MTFSRREILWRSSLAAELAVAGLPSHHAAAAPGTNSAAGACGCANAIVAEEHGVRPNGENMSPPLRTLLAKLYASGGGSIVFATGTYRFDDLIALPHDGNPQAPRGVPIRFLGTGAWFSSRVVASPAPGGTIFDCRYAGPHAWLMCLGEATFMSEGITYSQRGPVAHTTPYIKTTNTTLVLTRNSFEGHPSKGNALDKGDKTADQDCIILGGTRRHYGADGPDEGFQGYGTVITQNNFNRVQRGVYGRTYANGVVIADNQWWGQCGGVAAIEFDPDHPDEYCVGAHIAGNLIECFGYKYPIKLTGCSQMTLVGNNFYDQVPVPACIHLTRCQLMTVIGGVSDSDKAYVSDPAQCSFYASAAQTERTSMAGLAAGHPGLPNLLHQTIFEGGPGGVVIQSKEPLNGNSAKLVRLLRSAGDGTAAGAEIGAWGNDGALYVGGETGSGNIVNDAPGGGGFANQGRAWRASGAGGPMEINSGSGGSFLDLRNHGVRVFDPAGKQQLVMGAGRLGIGFGPAQDAEWVRHPEAALLTSNVPTGTAGYKVATLPAPSSALVGARAYVTDAVSPSFLAEAAGGGEVVCPVFCNGAAWVVG